MRRKLTILTAAAHTCNLPGLPCGVPQRHSCGSVQNSRKVTVLVSHHESRETLDRQGESAPTARAARFLRALAGDRHARRLRTAGFLRLGAGHEAGIDAMSRTFTSFTFRLERTPSPWTEISSSVLSATATVVAATVVYQMITHAVRPVSPLWWSLFGALGAIAAARVSDAYGKTTRLLLGRVPVVDIERHPWQPGEVQRVRVANPDVSDLKALDVTLEADAFPLAKVGATAAGSGGFSKLLHQERVFSASGRDLVTIDHGLDLVARVTLPGHAEGKNWRWRIQVRCHPRNGPVRQYWFPLPVDAAPVATAKAS
jgi:hypothetical protein